SPPVHLASVTAVEMPPSGILIGSRSSLRDTTRHVMGALYPQVRFVSWPDSGFDPSSLRHALTGVGVAQLCPSLASAGGPTVAAGPGFSWRFSPNSFGSWRALLETVAPQVVLMGGAETPAGAE
ncbi:MAG TPA: hypothetical protein VGA18_03120, partial [Rhodothermales bacterium]